MSSNKSKSGVSNQPVHVLIDVLINNGGRSQRSLFLDTSLEVYQALMDLNFLGTVSLTKQVLPHMTQRGAGTVVTVSSVAGLAGTPLATGYAASKHALQVRHVDQQPTEPLTHKHSGSCHTTGRGSRGLVLQKRQVPSNVILRCIFV